MRHLWFALVLAVPVALALPLAAGAISLDAEANAGAGLGLGSTNNPSETGSPGFAFQGGIEADLFLVRAGPVDLGFSTGLEYDNMTNYGTVNYPATPPYVPAITVNSDNNYVYLIVPFVLTSRVPLSPSMNLSLRAGGFYGFFMGGQATNITYNPPIGGPTSATLNSSNTPPGLLGLHFSGGVDFALGRGLFLSPSVIFNMGLTNITGTSMGNYTFANGSTYVDSLWSLSLMIGIKYNVF
jgi:hypothetical protein